MRVLDIVEGTSVDGPGLRTAIYFAGCRHRCHGCHNMQSWDMNGGHEMSVGEIVAIVEIAGFSGVTFSGGDPLYQAEELSVLASALKQLGYNIWCYTGFRWEEIAKLEIYTAVLRNIDVLVDGPFIEELHHPNLLFRGSSNQRLILAQESLDGEITCFRDCSAPAF